MHDVELYQALGADAPWTMARVDMNPISTTASFTTSSSTTTNVLAG